MVKNCKQCNKKFTPVLKADYCSNKCRCKYNRLRRKLLKKKIKTIVKCEECNVKFTQSRKNHLLCGRKCHARRERRLFPEKESTRKKDIEKIIQKK